MNRFELDTLESRRMMANVSVQLAGGLLQIAGTAERDAITVSVSGDTLLVKGGQGTTVTVSYLETWADCGGKTPEDPHGVSCAAGCP